MPDFTGTAGDDSLDGSASGDIFYLQQGGDDRADGGGGADGFYFGAQLGPGDRVSGGTGVDTIAVQGQYGGLALGDIIGVEVLLALSGSDTRFGDHAGNRYSYAVSTSDANLAAGETLTVQATGLLAGENLAFNGSAETDANFRIFAGQGIDHLTGGAGNDGFFFGSESSSMPGRNLSGLDRIDGGAGIDSVALRGDYFRWGASTFQDATFVNVEVLALLSGHTNEYGGALAPGGYRYWLTAADGNVAAGQRLDINAAGLAGDETVYFDGHNEKDGSYRILSGAADDQLTGGAGADIIYGGGGADELHGGAGADVYAYRALSESTVAKSDFIWDFDGGDKIDLSALDAIASTAARDAFTFIGTHEFNGIAGELRAAPKPGYSQMWWVEADVDGDKVADFQIRVFQDPARSVSQEAMVAADFILATPPAATIVIAETEPNDSLAAAQFVNRGNLTILPNAVIDDSALPSLTIHGEITDQDVDYFTISMWRGEKIVLDVDGATGTLDASLTIYGPDGKIIGSNDDLVWFDPGSSPGPFDHNTDSFLTFRTTAVGTYTFAIRAFDGHSTGAYDLHVSIAPPATAAQIQQEDIEALATAYVWDHTSLTFSFPTVAAEYPDYPADGEQQDNFHALNAQQQAAARSTLAGIAALTGLSFSEFSADRSAADIRYAMSDTPETAYAYLPSNDPSGGDAWFRYSGAHYASPQRGNYAYAAFIHETGHALGLKHAHEFPALSRDHDSMEYSIMSYRSFAGGGIDGFRNEEFGFAQSFMMYDIAALQLLYGANFATHAEDSIYRWNPTTGEMSINGVGQGAPGANRIFLTVWDGGGNDTYDLSAYGGDPATGGGVSIDLRPGEWTTTTQVQLANLGGQFARGNIANSLLYQGDPHSLIENAIGGTGGDFLTANGAVNHLTGGAGGDRFRWMSVSDSPVGAADTVTDFDPVNDSIDVMWIDADVSTEQNDGFNWIGGNPFSGAAGQFRGELVDGSLHLFGDVNGDMIADFEIVLANVHELITPPWLP